MSTNLPNNRIKKVKLPNNSEYEIIPERLQKNGFEIAPPENVDADSTIALTSNLPTKVSDLTNDRFVRYDTNAQGLNTTQKSNARTNIGLGTAATKNTGTSSGNVPVLDSNGKLDTAVLPAIAISDTFVVDTEVAMLALIAQVGDVCVRSDLNKSFILKEDGASTLSHWQELLAPGSVTSVNNKTGAVTLTAADVGALPSDYTPAIKALNTTNITSQDTNSNEAIGGTGTINLHKIAKTGKYSDLLNPPDLSSLHTHTNKTALDNLAISSTGVTDGTNTYNASNKLDKLTYEWNKSVAMGSSGYVKIGSFPMYDSNITIDIDATTAQTYHGTVVIATQNTSTTSMGSAHKVEVYDDPSGEIASAIRVVWTSGSRNYDVYFVPKPWSKNLIHIRAVALSSTATDVCISQTGTAPTSTSGLEAVNKLATVAGTGSYNDLTNKPTIPTVNNATLTITQGGVSKGTFTANSNTDTTIALSDGVTDYNDLDNIPIINLEEAPGFFYNNETLVSGDKVYFNTSKTSEMTSFLENLTYSLDDGGDVKIEPLAYGQDKFAIYAYDLTAMDLGYILMLGDYDGSSSRMNIIYGTQAGNIGDVSWTQGWNNLAADGSFTASLRNTETITVNSAEGWNGILIATNGSWATYDDGKYYKAPDTQDLGGTIYQSVDGTLKKLLVNGDIGEVLDGGTVSSSVVLNGSASYTLPQNVIDTICNNANKIYLVHIYGSYNSLKFNFYFRPNLVQTASSSADTALDLVSVGSNTAVYFDNLFYSPDGLTRTMYYKNIGPSSWHSHNNKTALDNLSITSSEVTDGTNTYNASDKLDKTNSIGIGYIAYNHKSGTSVGINSAIFGADNTAPTARCFAIGYNNTIAGGTENTAEGNSNTINGYYSHAEGYNNIIEQGVYAAHAEGNTNLITTTNPTSSGSTFEGHVEGSKTLVFGNNGHAEGAGSVSSSSYTFRSLSGNNAYNLISGVTIVPGDILVGTYNNKSDVIVVKKVTSDAITCNRAFTGSPYATTAKIYKGAAGQNAHSEGKDTAAIGDNSHAEGEGIVAISKSQHAFGEYNVPENKDSTSFSSRGDYVEIVGNGTSTSARSNARTLDWSGNEVLSGTVQATGFKTASGTSLQFLKADGSIDSSTYLKNTDGVPIKIIDLGTITAFPYQLSDTDYDLIINNDTVLIKYIKSGFTYFSFKKADNSSYLFLTELSFSSVVSGGIGLGYSGTVQKRVNKSTKKLEEFTSALVQAGTGLSFGNSSVLSVDTTVIATKNDLTDVAYKNINNTFTTSQSMTSAVLSNGTPLQFTGYGTGTYNRGALVCNTTDKFGVECPRTSDSSTASIVPFRIGVRGGQLGNLQTGSIALGSNSSTTTSVIVSYNPNTQAIDFTF